jgi:hypothetical protein
MNNVGKRKIKLFKNYSEKVEDIILAPFRGYSIGRYSMIIELSRPFWKNLQKQGYTGYETVSN